MSAIFGGSSAAGDSVARILAALNRFDIMRIDSLAAGEFGEAAVDYFVDETGVDTATSTDETYDATGDFYHNPAGGTDGTFAAADDNKNGLSTAYRSHGLKFTASASGPVSAVRINVATVNASGNYHVELWTDSAGSPGAQVGSDSDTLAISTTGDKTFSWTAGAPSLTGSTVYWVVIVWQSGNIDIRSVADQGAGFASGRHSTITSITDGVNGYLGDLKCEITITASAANMMLQSAAFTADAAPASARIVILEKDVDAVTINTDLIAAVSRDGGTTWTNFTLIDEGDFSSARRVLSGEVSVSGQPSGTSLKWRITAANNKEFETHGVSLIWGA